MGKIVTKEELCNNIEKLLNNFQIIGPVEVANKGIFYQPITDIESLYLGDGFAIEPIKKFFLNPSEYFFEEKFKDGNEFLEELPLAKSKMIIIGVRSCEARGLTLLDKVFDSRYKDNLYINNRKRTIIVGMECLEPDRNCFCTSIGGSPVDTLGMDAVISETENRFVVEIITDKGKEIFGSLGEDLKEEDRKSWQENKEKRKDLVKTKIRVPENLDNIFESDYWYKVSLACISCGVCTYLCPTCHCFDLVDEERKRMRCYDGCAFPDFTLQTSGENPRPTKRERYRQRVFHKFSYFKKNFGENLCVGCGRCIRHCPVKIDIADVVDKAPVSENR